MITYIPIMTLLFEFKVHYLYYFIRLHYNINTNYYYYSNLYCTKSITVNNRSSTLIQI